MNSSSPSADRDSKSPLFERQTDLMELKINGLFEAEDLTLTFDNAYTVFVAENGSGKTTCLFILQCLLKRDFSALLRYKFRDITVKFRDIEPISIPYSALVPRQVNSILRRAVGVPTSRISQEALARVLNLATTASFEELREQPEFRLLARNAPMPTRVIYDRLRNFMRHEVFRENDLLTLSEPSTDMKRVSDLLTQHFSMHVIYLPTYRRVEQDLKSLLSVESEPAELAGFIHFGMGDVQTMINGVTGKIRDHFVLSYGQTSGQMLGQLTETIQITPDMRTALSNQDEVGIVLSRVGPSVSSDVRNRIMRMVEDGSITENAQLSFFIFQLMAAYEAVKELDESMQAFANVCNGYLINKEFRYNSANATIQIHNTVTDTVLDLEGLSSGEKQLLGMMAELYLSQQERFAVIIDEPELSLSVEWQRKILPDIIRSGRCEFLTAATHSPFIFENDLDKYTRALVAEYRTASAAK